MRLRPLTAAQAAQRLSQPRLSVIAEGSRTFQPSRQLNMSEPFLNGTSSNYVEEMYSAWLENPKSVHKVQYASTLTCKNPQFSLKPYNNATSRPQTFHTYSQSSYFPAVKLHITSVTFYIWAVVLLWVNQWNEVAISCECDCSVLQIAVQISCFDLALLCVMPLEYLAHNTSYDASIQALWSSVLFVFAPAVLGCILP